MKPLACILLSGSALAQVCSGQEPAPLPASPPLLAAVKQPERANGGPDAPTPVFVEPTTMYFGGTAPTLTAQESAGVGITRAWEDRSYSAMEKDPGQDGAIRFRYGESLPVIVCAVLHVTDVALEPGEAITTNGVQLGDSVRWTVDVVESGSKDNPTQHLIVKPKDIGLSTDLVVTTDRRTYHLDLLSHDREFMHHVAFVYPGQPAASAASTRAAMPPALKPETVPGASGVRVAYEEPVSASKRATRQTEGKGEASSNRDDSYGVSGKAPWRPLSAYNDGRKTYLEMPSRMGNTEAPVIFLLRKSGPFGLGSQKLLTNYRVHGHWYVVDSVIDRAVMVAGVGSNQDKVTITRGK